MAIKRLGKVGLEWQKTRRAWIKANPPDYRGAYSCGICGQDVYRVGMELDHIIKKGSHAELRADLSNLRPTHRYCNQSRL